jgi:hypothetical protein
MDAVFANKSCWVCPMHIIIPKDLCAREGRRDATRQLPPSSHAPGGACHILPSELANLRRQPQYSAIRTRQPKASAHIVKYIQPVVSCSLSFNLLTTSAHPPLSPSINLLIPPNGTLSISFGLSRALFKVSKTASGSVRQSILFVNLLVFHGFKVNLFLHHCLPSLNQF